MIITPRTLSEQKLFAELDEHVRQKIVLYVRKREFAAGQLIALAREPCQLVYTVEKGVVRAFHSSLEGREYVLSYLGPGETFGLGSVIDGELLPFNVDALTDVSLYTIPCQRFRSLLYKHSSIALRVMEQLADDVRHLQSMVENLALYTVRTRLARFLLSRGGGDRPSRRWTQEEIANHIGTVRDVVGRTLRAFSREGLIRRERGRLVVRDRGGLEREAMRV